MHVHLPSVEVPTETMPHSMDPLHPSLFSKVVILAMFILFVVHIMANGEVSNIRNFRSKLNCGDDAIL